MLIFLVFFLEMGSGGATGTARVRYGGALRAALSSVGGVRHGGAMRGA